MPKYDSDIDYIIRKDDFKRMFRTATTNHDRALITLFWITGARPAEIMELRKKDINIGSEHIQIHISTKKLGKEGKFVVRKRTLVLKCNPEHPHIQSVIRHLAHFKNPESLIFTVSRRTLYNRIHDIGYDALGVDICPYNFRHSRLTLLAEAGATDGELMRFKGSRTRKSVSPYVHARKVEYTVEVEI